MISLSKYKVYNRASSTIVTTLHIRSSEHIYLINENLYPLLNFSPFPPSQPLVSTVLLSDSVTLTFITSLTIPIHEHGIFCHLVSTYFVTFSFRNIVHLFSHFLLQLSKNANGFFLLSNFPEFL